MTPQEYLDQHGITQESVEKFNLKITEDSITIPIWDQNKTPLYNKYRLLNGGSKYKFDPDTHPAIFNLSSIKDSSYVVLTEGEMDTIRLHQEGIKAVSGTAGANTFNPEWLEYFKGKKVFICYDTDQPGIEATKKVVELFEDIRVIGLPEDSKDICEYFQHHTRKEFAALMKIAPNKEKYMANNIKEEYRAVTLKEVSEMEFPEEEWIVEKIVPQTGIVMFVGESGSGKSFISLELTRAVGSYTTETETEFMDHFKVKQNVPILIIDKENGLRRIRRRMIALGVPASDNIFVVKYPQFFRLDDKEFMTSISQLIANKGVKIVILDSFIDILIGSENSSEDTQKVFDSIKSISDQVCWFILHHDSKPQPKQVRTAAQKTRGSSNILGQVDYQFYVEKTKSPKVFNIEQGKARDNEPVNKFSVEMMSTEDGQMSGFRYVGEVKSEVTQLSEAMDQAYSFIKDHPGCTRDDIEAILATQDISGRAVKDALINLEKKNLIDFHKKPGAGNKKFYSVLAEENPNEEYGQSIDVSIDEDEE